MPDGLFPSPAVHYHLYMHFPIELPEHILALAAEWKILPEDIEEFHTHGGGHGGQNLNKSTNCVELTHKPTGTTVRHQHHRGLLQNRIEAYELLIQKIAEESQKKAHEEHERQYRETHPEGWSRSKHGKEQSMHDKHHHSAKKAERSPSVVPVPEEMDANGKPLP